MSLDQASYAVTTRLNFTCEIPDDGTSLADTDKELAERFQAVGGLADAIDYIAEHDWSTEQPDLGVLTTRFLVAKPGEKAHPATHSRYVTPMGANRDVLLGCLNLPTPVAHAERPLEEGETVSVFGTNVTIGSSGLAYAVLDRRRVRASRKGVMQYPARLAVFSSLPDKEGLYDFADSVVPGTSDFLIARVDATVKTVDEARGFRR